MQTVELDFEDIQSPKEIMEFLNNLHFGAGDILQLKVEEKQKLFILTIVFFVISQRVLKKRKREKEGEKILADILDRYDNAEDLEKDIEKEYGISIEFEIKNPLNDAFGLWKDYDIDAETLRKEAWQRKR